MVVFGKGRGRRRKTVWQWKDKEREGIQKFNSLGIILTKSEAIKGHLKEILKKKNNVMGKVWAIAEREFKK